MNISFSLTLIKIYHKIAFVENKDEQLAVSEEVRIHFNRESNIFRKGKVNKKGLEAANNRGFKKNLVYYKKFS